MGNLIHGIKQQGEMKPWNSDGGWNHPCSWMCNRHAAMVVLFNSTPYAWLTYKGYERPLVGHGMTGPHGAFIL